MGAPKDKPRFGKPTQQMRDLVLFLAGCGNSQEDICYAITATFKEPISVESLVKHFRKELDSGRAVLAAKVQRKLFEHIMERDNLAACLFFLKTRCGWRETAGDVEVSIDGADIKTVRVVRETKEVEAIE
jgi:hypothetical protein